MSEGKYAELVEGLCGVMHDAYEAAAAKAGWETQERSRKPWADVPEANKVTMRAAVAASVDALTFMGWVSPEEAKAREAAARREALLEAEGKSQFVLSQTWNDGWASGVADAACWQRGEDVQATRNPYGTEVGDRIRTTLAEPERDEESGR